MGPARGWWGVCSRYIRLLQSCGDRCGLPHSFILVSFTLILAGNLTFTSTHLAYHDFRPDPKRRQLGR